MSEALETFEVQREPTVKITEINRLTRTGQRFRDALKRNGINISRFAEVAGLTPNYVYHVLGDYPGFEVSDRFIETALNCPIIAHLGLTAEIFDAKSGGSN